MSKTLSLHINDGKKKINKLKEFFFGKIRLFECENNSRVFRS